MNDNNYICKISGQILLENEDIYDDKVDPVQLGAKVDGLSKPNPFQNQSMIISHMVLIHGLAANKSELDEIVEQSLRRAAIWDEVKDR